MSNVVTIPTKTWKKIEAWIDEQRTNDEWWSEKKACEELGIDKRTLNNYVGKQLKKTDVSKGVGGNKFYRRKAIIGLDKKIA